MLIAFGAAVNKSGNGVAIDSKAKIVFPIQCPTPDHHRSLCALLNTGESPVSNIVDPGVFDQTLPAYSLLNSVLVILTRMDWILR